MLLILRRLFVYNDVFDVKSKNLNKIQKVWTTVKVQTEQTTGTAALFKWKHVCIREKQIFSVGVIFPDLRGKMEKKKNLTQQLCWSQGFLVK